MIMDIFDLWNIHISSYGDLLFNKFIKMIRIMLIVITQRVLASYSRSLIRTYDQLFVLNEP